MTDSASPSIDHLEETWRAIAELGADLTPEQWDTATGCPGWTVKDNVSHLIDHEATAMGRPRPDHVPSSLAHTKNPMGESNEIGVDARRSHSGTEVLAEFEEVTGARLAQLRAMSPDDLLRETFTPVGPGTVAQMLTLRVMDTWTHEQDIRRALGRPGHDQGGAPTETVAYFAQFLPLIIGKRAGAPDGAAVLVIVEGVDRYPIVMEEKRARLTDDRIDDPTVTISLSAPTFAALVGGRSDAPDDAVIEGDVALGHAVLDHLGFMP
jgi:uncharacterized protein (TIGR03083 family)